MVPPSATSGPITVTVRCRTTTGPTFTVGLPGIIISSHPVNRIVCDGNTTTFSVFATGPGVISYQWQKDAVDIVNGTGYSGVTTNTLTVNTTGTFGTGSYRCRISSSIASSINSNNATLTLNSVPNAPTVIGSSSCDAASLTLNASGGSPGQYRWYTVPAGGIAIAGQTNDTYSPVLTTTTSYFVSINDGTCESVRTAVTATVIPLPTAPTVTAASGFAPAALTLTASGASNGQYRWYTTSTGGTALAGEVNDTFTTPAITVSTTYYVSINNGQCESTRTPVIAEIKINTAPSILATNATTTVAGTVSVSLTALISDPEDNLDFSTLAITKQPISGAKATIDPQYNLNLDYSGISFAGTDKLSISICDQLAACSEKELSIEVVGEITVYNAVSSNDDGKNEIFYLKNIEVLADTKENKVTIFNRWGDVVFEADNYDNNQNVFRGLNKNGTELPSGTYFYQIKFASGLEEKTGFIALKK